jgi:hypothetical protein
MRTALDALSAEHGAVVRLPHAASRVGMPMRLVPRHVDAPAHPFEAFEVKHMHNTMHLHFLRLATGCSIHNLIKEQRQFACCERALRKNRIRFAPPFSRSQSACRCPTSFTF